MASSCPRLTLGWRAYKDDSAMDLLLSTASTVATFASAQAATRAVRIYVVYVCLMKALGPWRAWTSLAHETVVRMTYATEAALSVWSGPRPVAASMYAPPGSQGI